LSRKIIGVLFNLYNTLGYGHPEKTYQKALAVGFQQVGLNFKEQLYSPVYFGGKLVGKNYFDFEIE
jgi:GxxExxY protein